MTGKQYITLKPALRRILLTAWETTPTEAQIFQAALVLARIRRMDGAA